MQPKIERHTPGPWEIRPRPKYGGWEVGRTLHIRTGQAIDAMTGRVLPAHNVVERIALVPMRVYGAGEANARLIATAPDLLAAAWQALGALSIACGGHDDEYVCDGCRVREALRAVIAKATGEDK